jgi:hypothetical protein
MKRALKRTLKVSGLFLGAVALLGAIAAALLIFDKPLVRNILQKRVAKSAGMTVRVGKLDYSLFPFRLSVEDLELVQDTPFLTLSVSLENLRAEGGFWKLVRGVKPALETVSAGGVRLRLEQRALSTESLDLEDLVLQASDTLAWAKRISLTGARLSLSLLAQDVNVEGLDVTLTAGKEVGDVAYVLGPCGLDVKDKAGAFALRTGLRSSGTLRLAAALAFDAVIDLDAPRLKSGGTEDSLPKLRVEAAGRVDLAAQEGAVTRLKAGVPGLFDLEGTAAGRFGHSLFLQADARLLVDKIEDLAARLGPRLPADLRDVFLRGRADLSAKYGIQQVDQETRDNLTASLALDGVELVYRLGRTPLHLKLSGRVDASGPSRRPRIAADLKVSAGKAAFGPLTLGASSLRLIVTADQEAVDFSRFEASAAGLGLEAAPGRNVSFDKVALAGRGRLDLARRNVTVPALEAKLPGLPPLLFSGRLALDEPGPAEVMFGTRGLDLPAVRGLAAPFLPPALSGWDLAGAADLSLEARRPAAAGGVWTLSGTASLTQVRFNDPSFTIAGEGLSPELRFEGALSGPKGIPFTASLAVGQGESLWKAVYISWSKHPLGMTLAGRFVPGSGGVEDLSARILFPTIGEIDLTGAVRTRPLTSFDLSSEAKLSLGPLYSLYALAGASEATRLNLEGTLTSDLRVRGRGDALSVAGKMALAGVNLERPASKMLLVGVSAELPILYETGAEAVPPDAPLPEEGFVRVEEFQHPLLTLKPLALSLRVGPNALAIEPLALDLFGGRLELGRTTFRLDPRSGELQGLGSLAIREIDIARFPIASPQFKLTGKVRAEFPRLDISAKAIAVAGRGEADVFGGKVVLRDFAVADPFKPGRAVSLNVDLVDLDLKKLTDEVPFGEVTGIVRGEVRNLVISYGQPERFEFRIESVPRRGVPQTFSLKAVDNLTVLSSGQQASGGTGGFWMSFVRGFHYQKLGIVSTLRNDTFTLNGTIHEGGVEYLVKKPALFGISVINREPDKVISFKEMTSRLKRVGQSEK